MSALSPGLAEAIGVGDEALVRVALAAGERPTAEHLRLTVECFSGPSRLRVARALVHHGADPLSGHPSATEKARRAGDVELVWTLTAAWLSATADANNAQSVSEA